MPVDNDSEAKISLDHDPVLLAQRRPPDFQRLADMGLCFGEFFEFIVAVGDLVVTIGDPSVFIAKQRRAQRKRFLVPRQGFGETSLPAQILPYFIIDGGNVGMSFPQSGKPKLQNPHQQGPGVGEFPLPGEIVGALLENRDGFSRLCDWLVACRHGRRRNSDLNQEEWSEMGRAKMRDTVGEG